MHPTERLVHLAMYHPVPRTWGDCQNAKRYLNCEVARCRYNLRYDIQKNGVARTNATQSCALAVAEEGEHIEEQVAKIMGMSRQYIHQMLYGYPNGKPGILQGLRNRASFEYTLNSMRAQWEEGGADDWNPTEGSLE